MVELTNLIQHPELMDKETLYDLRSLLALHPCYQSARILLLQNLYLLHDPSFDEELRRAAIYITDRRVLFNLIEASHYKLRTPEKHKEGAQEHKAGESRSIELINNFLESIPSDEESMGKKKRKPTPADATVDYVAYLLETENEEERRQETPQLKGLDLIDSFIRKNEEGKIQLSEEPEYTPELDDENNAENGNGGYYTETLAKIYIKQGDYSRALQIIQRLYLNYPKKNAYFADQMRFLEKLILNNKK